jgi:hypothetical protein
MNTKYRNELLILFFIFSIIFSFEGIYLFSQTETIAPALLVASYVVGIIFLESLFLFIISYLVKPFFLLITSIILASNLFVLKLLFFSWFQNISVLTIFVIIIIFSLIFFILLHSIKHLNKLKKILYILIGIIIFVFSPLITFIINERHDIKEVMPNSTLEQWKQIKFKDKPNIYLISFDSMIPSEISKKYMAIKELPYTSTVKADMLRKVPSFTPKAPSYASLNGIMNLEDVSIPGRSFFSGIMPSILTSIVSSNGYEITTGYSSFYFGKQGTYIDKYKMPTAPRLIETTLCIDTKTSFILQIRLLGVCNVLGKYSSISFFLYKEHKDWVTRVLDTFQENYYKIRPQFSFMYIYRPNGHSPRNYRHADLTQRQSYRDYFLSQTIELNKILHNLIKTVKAQDPKSIVIVFGDHGAWLSRGISYKQNRDFFILDRYTIELAALKTENLCVSNKKIFHYSSSYATPSRVLAAVFRCLAENPQKVDDLVNFANIDEYKEIYENQFLSDTVKRR